MMAAMSFRKFMKNNTFVAKRGKLAQRVALVALGFTFSLTALRAQSIHFAAHAGKGGRATTSSCVFLDTKGTLATVVEIGSDVKKATLVVGEKKIPLKFVVNDADSRAAIYQIPADSLGVVKGSVVLGSSRDLTAGQAVYASATDKTELSRVVNRVHRFQGKILPLAVLRINHAKAAPKPGSGIYDAQGKLVGIVRQAVYNAPNSSYCLPVEVITRIRADHKRNGRVGRCWIGIIMDELVAPPIVESVRPDSPAKKAGLKNGDVILSIEGHPVSEYAEVVDAFYYFIAGETQKFRILRGTEIKEFDVTPEVSPGR